MKIKSNYIFIFLTCFALLSLSALPVKAQTCSTPTYSPENESDYYYVENDCSDDTWRKRDFWIQAYGGHVFQADVENNQGKYSVNELGVVAGWKYFEVAFYRDTYNWQDIGSLPFGNGVDDPWKDLYTGMLTAWYDGEFNQDWGYFILGEFSTRFEKELGPLALQTEGGVRYKIWKDYRISVGGKFTYHPIGWSISPIFGITTDSGKDGDGPPQPGWTFMLGYPESYITYRFNRHFAATLAGSSNGYTYRLADDSPVVRKGYVNSSEYAVGLNLHVSPSDAFHITLGGGYLFGRKLTFYNNDTDKLTDYDVDPTPYGKLFLTYRF